MTRRNNGSKVLVPALRDEYDNGDEDEEDEDGQKDADAFSTDGSDNSSNSRMPASKFAYAASITGSAAAGAILTRFQNRCETLNSSDPMTDAVKAELVEKRPNTHGWK